MEDALIVVIEKYLAAEKDARGAERLAQLANNKQDELWRATLDLRKKIKELVADGAYLFRFPHGDVLVKKSEALDDIMIRTIDKIVTVEPSTITDGFGQFWPSRCPDCGAEMQVIRPGRATCANECWIEKEE